MATTAAVRKVVYILSFVLALIALGACAGGGTSGTGLVRMMGMLTYEDGTPIANAEVVLAEGEQVVTTDEQGNFEAEVASAEQVTIEVRAPGIDDAVSVELPRATSNVDVNVTVARVDGEITSATATPREVTPTPLPTTAAPTRTPQPTVIPRATPIRTPGVTVTPTVASTVRNPEVTPSHRVPSTSGVVATGIIKPTPQLPRVSPTPLAHMACAGSVPEIGLPLSASSLRRGPCVVSTGTAVARF